MNVLNKVTRKNLRQNRVRTLVTIIGVILSVAMITAVTTLISSLQQYLVDSVISTEGDWTLKATETSDKLLRQLQDDDRVDRIGQMQALGYAKLEGGQNADKPYWYVTAWDEDMLKTVPVRLTQGRMPQNGSEIVVPENMADIGGVSYKPGDRVTLKLGYREWNGERLNQYDSYYGEDAPDDNGNAAQAAPEKLVPVATRTFTVVGVCKRFSYDIEFSNSPGFTAVTLTSPQDQVLGTDLYIREKNPGQSTLDSELTEMCAAREKKDRTMLYAVRTHDTLLQMMGYLENDNLMLTIGSMAAILLLIIMVGSVSLIHNAFSISVSERSRQFGLLSSVGATRKQLRGSVLYEALLISGIGIPLGVLAGIGGIGVALYAVRDWIRGLLFEGDATIHLVVEWWAVAAAVLLGLVTILISAWIPAKRAARVTAIEAIRQSQDIQIKAKQVKTSRLTRKLFGFEGELALKNLKRSRRRYRSTVFSLAISVILFIATSSFTLYATRGVTQVVEDVNYDVVCYFEEVNYPQKNASDEEQRQQAFQLLLQLDSVQSGALTELVPLNALLPQELVDENYYQKIKQTPTDVAEEERLDKQGNVIQSVMLYALNEEAFDAYAQSCGLRPADYKGDQLTAIALRQGYNYNNQSGRYETDEFFRDTKPHGLSLWNYAYDEDGHPLFPEGKSLSINLAGYTTQLPIGLERESTSRFLYLMIPDAQMQPVREWLRSLSGPDEAATVAVSSPRMVFKAEDSAQAAQDVKTWLTQNNRATEGVYDMHESDEYNQRFLAIMKVFVYGFVALMALITVANVFNTISTNIQLRRREFAMLQSVGMSPKGFGRMMRFECIFYGLKALLYGLPLAAVITYIIYLALGISVDVSFEIPWSSVLISVCGVFLVVFVTMLYATHKIRKENIIVSLKMETT